MHLRTLFSVLGLALALCACADTTQYPISGQDCAPDDPVQSMTDAECAPA